VSALWLFTKSLWLHRNTLVHGADAEESPQHILTGLRDQVRQHYFAFNAEEGYVLARHHYLFTSRTLEQRLSLSYNYVSCWLRSVDEAHHQLETHVASQQFFATRRFGPHPPPMEEAFNTDPSDEDYVATTSQDTVLMSLDTASTQPSTCTDNSSVLIASSLVSWCTLLDGSIIEELLSDKDTSLLGSFGLPISKCDTSQLDDKDASISTDSLG